MYIYELDCEEFPNLEFSGTEIRKFPITIIMIMNRQSFHIYQITNSSEVSDPRSSYLTGQFLHPTPPRALPLIKEDLWAPALALRDILPCGREGTLESLRSPISMCRMHL